MEQKTKKVATKLDAKDRKIVVLEAEIERLQRAADEQGRRAATAENKLAEAEKKLESGATTLKYATDGRDEAKHKLAQIDGFLDALPNPPARQVEDANGYGKTNVDTVSRLMTYIATRG